MCLDTVPLKAMFCSEPVWQTFQFFIVQLVFITDSLNTHANNHITAIILCYILKYDVKLVYLDQEVCTLLKISHDIISQNVVNKQRRVENPHALSLVVFLCMQKQQPKQFTIRHNTQYYKVLLTHSMAPHFKEL